MFEVYYTDNLMVSQCVHKCNTLNEAKNWIKERLKGRELVEGYYNCTEVFPSSKTAFYEVYDGKPVSLNEIGGPVFASPVFESDNFYID